MRLFSSPVDLQSLTPASPVFYQLYWTHHALILKPMIHQMQATYPKEHLERVMFDLPHRMKRQVFPYLGSKELAEMFLTFEFPAESSTRRTRRNGLPAICEFYRQREEGDNLIAEYALQAWNKLLWETRVRSKFDSTFKRLPEFFRPMVLSEAEISRLLEGLIDFECWSHGGCLHPREALDDFVSWEMMAAAWSHTPSVLDGYRDGDDSHGLFVYIFIFVFDKFQDFVHRVAQKLEECPYQHQDMSCSAYNRI
ncbi:hypothetical protein FBEOM_14229 [Fusarium beomiforme]|uniref:Uncharacterized protein n=1 Tax=Fusarium beomiforme TaxID=44412 RepID=A0A9P5A447_9HYPO|nr:hypothetical protein FBEOM_14229 [Fusarium beomiforme]